MPTLKNSRMKRSVAYPIAIFALLASPLLAAPLPEATVVRVDLVNTSNTCAWVSLYLRRNQTPWEMETSSESAPRNIQAGSRHTFYVRFRNSFSVPLPAEIKALVAFKSAKDCSGSVIASAYGNAQVFAGEVLEKVDIKSTLSGPPYAVSVSRSQ
jgi:hypothetical protein